MVSVTQMLVYDVSDQISRSALHLQISLVSHIPSWEHGCIRVVNDQAKAKQQDQVGWHRCVTSCLLAGEKSSTETKSGPGHTYSLLGLFPAFQ